MTTKSTNTLAEKKVEKKKMYTVELHINDEVFTAKSEDISEALESMRPVIMKTHVVIKVTDGKKSAERFLLLQKARMMFRNKIGIDAFVRSIILK